MAVEGGAAAVDKENDEQSTQLRRVRFRSYRPRDPELQKYCEEVPNVRDVLFATLAEQDAVLSAANVKFASAALDFDNMVPKKSNWELKRALKPRLDRLERRTQRALLELAREAAQRQAGSAEGGEQLARSVAGAQLVDSDDEDDQ